MINGAKLVKGDGVCSAQLTDKAFGLMDTHFGLICLIQ